MKRQWYPGRLGALDVRVLLRLAVSAHVRGVRDRLRTPAHAVALALSTAMVLFAVAQGFRVASSTRVDPVWLFAMASAVAVWVGIRRWLQHLGSRPEDSAWIVLGGDPRAGAAAAIVSFAVVSVLLMAYAVLLSNSRGSLADAARWWALATAVWAGLCIALSRTRRGLRHASRYVSAHRHAAAGSSPHRATSRARTPIEIGLRLFARTMAGQAFQSVAFVALVAFAIIPGVQRLEGGGPALAFGGGLLIVTLLAFTGSVRAKVGRQHVFLLLHRRQVRRDVWRSLAAGQAIGVAIFAAAAFALIGAGTPVWRSNTGTWLLGVMAVEWAFYLALAAHLFAARGGRDDGVRLMMMQVTGAVLLAALIGKGLAIGYLTSRWLIVPASAICCLLAVRAAGRPPLRLSPSTRETL